MTAAKRSGAELRKARAVKEAIRREHSFLGNLAGAQDDYEWIVEHEAWTDLGHETFADWWQVRVQPTMRALSMRPNRELANKVLERVRADEAELPPAQRRTQRELADLAGVHPDTASGRKRQDPSQAEVPPTVDLDGHELPANQEFGDAVLAEIDQSTDSAPTATEGDPEPTPAGPETAATEDTPVAAPPEFVPSPNGPVPAAFAAALDKHVPNPDPHAEWRLGYLKRIHAVHAVMRSKPADVAEMANGRCLDELARCVEALQEYRREVDRAVMASTPDNVTPIRRTS